MFLEYVIELDNERKAQRATYRAPEYNVQPF